MTPRSSPLDRDLNWDEIEGVIADAHRVVAERMPRPRTTKARRA